MLIKSDFLSQTSGLHRYRLARPFPYFLEHNDCFVFAPLKGKIWAIKVRQTTCTGTWASEWNLFCSIPNTVCPAKVYKSDPARGAGPKICICLTDSMACRRNYKGFQVHFPGEFPSFKTEFPDERVKWIMNRQGHSQCSGWPLDLELPTDLPLQPNMSWEEHQQQLAHTGSPGQAITLSFLTKSHECV